MTRLQDIGVKVVPASEDSGALTVPARAILHELAALVERLVDSGEGGSIDLCSLPLGPGDHERLEVFLGQGEVSRGGGGARTDLGARDRGARGMVGDALQRR